MSETSSPASATVSVRLIGGPADWHGQTLNIHTAEDLAAPRETLGAYLISSGVPASHPDPGARAVYEPDDEPGLADVWFFRGWVPVGPDDPEQLRADHVEDVEMVLDDDGLPVSWIGLVGGAVAVDRVHAHWQATGEGHLAPDVWQVQATGEAGPRMWELRDHLGDRWEAGPIT